MSVLPIHWSQLALCMAFVVVAAGASLVLRLGLERDLLWGSVRTFAQLFLVGYVLHFIFDLRNPALVLLYYVWMIFWAARAVRKRVNEDRVRVFGPTFVSMVVSYILVTAFVTGAIVGARPWYLPQYFIPLGGMIIGNSMNAVSIGLDRLFSDLRKQRAEIELAFCLGATYQEATNGYLRDAVRSGMIPSVNALMTVGLVSLPGMMTGQILAGQPPLQAIRYQIVVMLMLVASTAIGSVIVIHLIRRMCFSKFHQMSI